MKKNPHHLYLGSAGFSRVYLKRFVDLLSEKNIPFFLVQARPKLCQSACLGKDIPGQPASLNNILEMACLCCLHGCYNGQERGSIASKSSTGGRTLGTRASSLYQIEQVDPEMDDARQRNAQQLRMQLMLTEELSSQTYGLEVSKNDQEHYEAQDFFIFKEILGSGSTAVVFRAIFKPTGSMLAVKFIPNFRTVKTMVMRELKVLKLANESRFLIDFHSHFRVGQNLYFVMEVCEGGTLNELLSPKHHMPAKLMKVYLKEMASALFFLHGQKLVHRDVSLENLFIDSTGHLKLGDFGLCRIVDDPQGEMMTDCGKPHIKAPEIYMDKPSGFPLDWWSVGILVYRFITGYYPFKTEKLTQGYHSVTKHQEKYPEWAFEDSNAKALCQGLLNKKPRERLASDNEVTEIQGHPYFQGMNWSAKEDVVAIASTLLVPGEDASMTVVVQRLLDTLGVPSHKVNEHLAAVYPPKSATNAMPPTRCPSANASASAFKKPFSVLSALPKGDGQDADGKEFRDKTILSMMETAV
ncbi:protein kinase C [Elysia marginata]|uniref:Protein kinase C n=1 Tax=Elysia marginata TaxID=1093978 RepID=A0AAV4J9A6_9GAST|nr:protein kinase C [Elysia marginata]